MYTLIMKEFLKFLENLGYGAILALIIIGCIVALHLLAYSLASSAYGIPIAIGILTIALMTVFVYEVRE